VECRKSNHIWIRGYLLWEHLRVYSSTKIHRTLSALDRIGAGTIWTLLKFMADVRMDKDGAVFKPCQFIKDL